MKKITEKDITKIKDMVDDSKNVLLATDNGVVIAGRDLEIANLFSNMIMRMKESGFDTELLKLAFEEGLKDPKSRKKERAEFEKFSKDILSTIRNVLNDVLGDDEDE